MAGGVGFGDENHTDSFVGFGAVSAFVGGVGYGVAAASGAAKSGL